MPSGYYRFPTLHADTVVFVCEDDLWTVPLAGGVARRLTSGLGEATHPVLSPDGTQLAFVGREEGAPEVYVMPALGGQTQRLTYHGASVCEAVGWTSDQRIVFASNTAQPFLNMYHLYSMTSDGRDLQRVNVGIASTITFGPQGGVVIGRNTRDAARWKRYRGGTAGRMWIDHEGNGDFQTLIQLDGNPTSPMWIGERIFFLSDHEGIGNLYSVSPSGEDLRRHTHHEDYYARNAKSDGQRIVYHAGADLYVFDVNENAGHKIVVAFHSPQTQRNRKFVDARQYLQDWTLHPKGHSIAITARGKLFSFGNWEGAVLHHSEADGVRYRIPEWLNDGKRLVAVSDAEGEESFVVLPINGASEPERLDGLDIGRVDALKVNPKKDQIAFRNHRYELMFLDLETRELRAIDRGTSSLISGFDWSPDGRWLAYSVSISLQVTVLKLWNVESGESHLLTQPVLADVGPSFDPEGKYLYFLSYRNFDPVSDNLQFELSFPRGVRPYLITLRKDLESPFTLKPHALDGKKDDDEDDVKHESRDEQVEKRDEDEPPDADQAEESQESERADKSEDKSDKEDDVLRIDLDGIERRVVAFPVDEARYGRIRGLKDGKVLYSAYPIEGLLKEDDDDEPSAKGSLYVYHFEDLKEEWLLSGMVDFALSRDSSTVIYRSSNSLRVIKAGEKPAGNSGVSRKSGWINLRRVSVPVVPALEWRQMFREAWRLQRDQFWTPDMSQVDWLIVHDRYLPLVERVSSRAEFSDLMWEMQGELGTSHAYEFGGDYRRQPHYQQGFLGADFEYDEETTSWRVTGIAQGDAWDAKSDSPLNAPGVNLQTGDRLLAINGRKLSHEFSPAMCLVNLAGDEVTLTVVRQADQDHTPGTVTVKTLEDEDAARYRQWVDNNRRHVHDATDGRVGYIHVPDMGPAGYAEFHRGYLAEVDREGLIVDVRYNRGGYVSALLLEKLSRRRIGYDLTRWGAHPVPYPPESMIGPLVALTNEQAGSDGDIFSHGFKMMKLGPLIGKRTWGGVIGINPRHSLVDGTITTQPEFSFWFNDVGWGVENYGTDPDIEVDNTPQDYIRGVDTQLERAIEEVMKLLAENPPQLPEFNDRPSRALPRLPKV